MRSVWIPKAGPPEILEVREGPDPVPRPGEVLVRVRATGVNFADVSARLGMPNACNNCHTKQTPRWAGDAISKWTGKTPLGYQNFAEAMRAGTLGAPTARGARHKPKPWTKDPILRDWRFCNVCRADDTVSQWIMNEWYAQNESAPPRTMVLAAALARNINWPASLECIGFPLKWDPNKALRALLDIEGKVFTGAYIINGARGGDKRGQVIANMDTIYRSMDESGFPLLSAVV